MKNSYLLISTFFCLINATDTLADEESIPKNIQEILNNQSNTSGVPSTWISVCHSQTNIVYKTESHLKYGSLTSYFDSKGTKLGESSLTSCYEDKERSEGTIPDISKFDCKKIKIRN